MSHPRKSVVANRPEGWAMTRSQASMFWHLWSQACACQGWNKLKSAERDEKRYEMLRECGFVSLTHVDSTAGFDRVKARLLRLCDQVSNEPADAGRRRRVLAVIGERLADLEDAGYAARAVDTLFRERFKIIQGVRSLTDLETTELVNVAITLSERLKSWKSRASAAESGPLETPVQPAFNPDSEPISKTESAELPLVLSG